MNGSEKIYLQSNDVTLWDHVHTYDVTEWDHEHLYDVILGTMNYEDSYGFSTSLFDKGH